MNRQLIIISIFSVITIAGCRVKNSSMQQQAEEVATYLTGVMDTTKQAAAIGDPMTSKPIVVGLTGPNAAGKGEAAAAPGGRGCGPPRHSGGRRLALLFGARRDQGSGHHALVESARAEDRRESVAQVVERRVEVQRYGLPALTRRNANTLNNWRAYYSDRMVVERVAQRYRKDLAHFGYEQEYTELLHSA